MIVNSVIPSVGGATNTVIGYDGDGNRTNVTADTIAANISGTADSIFTFNTNGQKVDKTYAEVVGTIVPLDGTSADIISYD